MPYELVELTPEQFREFESVFNKYSTKTVSGERVVRSAHLSECITATLSEKSASPVVENPSEAWLSSVLAIMDPDAEGVLPFDDAVLVVRRYLTEQQQLSSIGMNEDAEEGEADVEDSYRIDDNDEPIEDYGVDHKSER